MTRDEILALEGRELDVAVAESIFGWHWTRGREAHSTDDTVYRWLHPPKSYTNFTPATGDEPMLGGSIYFVPAYSADIGMAWQIVDYMLDWDGPFWWDDFSMRSHRSADDSSWTWGAGFRYWTFPQNETTVIVEAMGNTAPLAICRAALLAAQKDKEDE